MNYLCARERPDGWVYTYNGCPTGYCQEYELIPEDGLIPAELARQENERMEPHRSKFHAAGHDTKEAACACYQQYLLDTRLYLQPEEPERASQQHKCGICGAWTACHARVGGHRMFALCPQHQTRECVEQLYRVGESWES